MAVGLAIVLVGCGVLAIGGIVPRVLGTALVVVGIFVMPYLTVFGND
jgi:hypothetical protein